MSYVDLFTSFMRDHTYVSYALAIAVVWLAIWLLMRYVKPAQRKD